MKLRSRFGKDIIDSLGGAVYNATLRVNLDELSYLSSEILVDDSIILNNSANKADQYFGFNTNNEGVVSIMNENSKTVDEQIEEDINKEIANVNNTIKEYKRVNPQTTLTDQQILEVMNDFNDDGLIIF